MGNGDGQTCPSVAPSRGHSKTLQEPSGVQTREVERGLAQGLQAAHVPTGPGGGVAHRLAELNMVVCTWVLVAQAQEQPAVAAH